MSSVDTVKRLINDMLSPYRRIFTDSFILYDDIFGECTQLKSIGHSHLRRVNEGLNSRSVCFCVDKDTIVVIYNGKMGFWHKGYLLYVHLNDVGMDGWNVGLNNGKPVAYSPSSLRCINTVFRVDRDDLLPKYVEPVDDTYFVLPVVSNNKLRGIQCGKHYNLSPLYDGELLHYGDFGNVVPNAMFDENVNLVIEGKDERLTMSYNDFQLLIKLGILPLRNVVNIYDASKSLRFYNNCETFIGKNLIWGNGYVWRDGILFTVPSSSNIVISENGRIVPFGGRKIGAYDRHQVLRLLI